MIYAKSDSYFTVWDITVEDRRVLVNATTSKKDKRSGEYVNSSWSYMNFVGNAYAKACKLNRRDRITNLEFGLTNEQYVDKDGNKVYPKSPRIVVFDFEVAAPRTGGKKPSTKAYVDSAEGDIDIDDDGDLPF